MNGLAACYVVVAAAAIAVSPEATADHDTVGGGTWSVSNSDGPCTYFEYADLPFTGCIGSWIDLPPGRSDYIVVPLGSNLWVSCSTYAPGGQLFEYDIEYLAEVPRKQKFWLEQGWGPYTPQAMCQLW